MALSSIENQVVTARELTGAGDYAGALVYYDGALSQIARYIAQIKDPYIIGKWHETVKALQVEQADLKQINNELNAIRDPPAAAPRPAARFQEYDDPRHNQVMNFDDMFTRAPPPVSHTSDMHDPEVWRPPSREGHRGGTPSGGPRAGYPPRKGNADLPAWARKEMPSRAGPSNVGSGGRDRSAPRSGARTSGGNQKAGAGKGEPGARSTPPGANGNGNGKGKEAGARTKPTKEYVGPDGDLAEMLQNDVIDTSPGVKWTDIAGLEDAKRILEEAMVLPLIMPEFFTGIRTPHKGVLLFGPPGTGKTMLAKAVATECNCTFFNISSATLASKYRGESERMVRCLFELARVHAPSVIFIDEVDSLCTSRGKEGEHEASRRVKSELLVQIDGCHGSTNEDGSRVHVMVLAATNFPWDIDEAFRRRLEKRIYIPLPKVEEAKELLRINLRTVEVDSEVDFDEIARQLQGYSGDDVTNICKDAAMNIMRRKIAGKRLTELKDAGKELIKEPITMDDFLQAIHKINPSVSQDDIKKHEQWLSVYGSV